MIFPLRTKYFVRLIHLDLTILFTFDSRKADNLTAICEPIF
jgi:hypothetical protein